MSYISSSVFIVYSIILSSLCRLECNNSTFSPGSKRFVQFNSISSCQTACLTRFTNCIAIEVSRDPVECWIHLGNDTELITDTRIDWPRVNQYLPDFHACNSSYGEYGHFRLFLSIKSMSIYLNICLPVGINNKNRHSSISKFLV